MILMRQSSVICVKKHNLLIGERTAEDIKIKIGTTYPLVEEETMEVRGRNLVTGLPKTVTVTSSETEEALREATGQIVEAVIAVLEQTPPELSADILGPWNRFDRRRFYASRIRGIDRGEDRH